MAGKVYFDLDGVLADFEGGIVELAGADPDDDDALWEAIAKVDGFYAKLAPLPGAFAMFHEAKVMFSGSVEVLSAPPKPKRGMPEAEADKRRWCSTWLGEDVPVNIVYSEEKSRYCTGAEDILIDDRKSNIDDWVEAGGTGILHTSVDDTLRELSAIAGAWGDVRDGSDAI